MTSIEKVSLTSETRSQSLMDKVGTVLTSVCCIVAIVSVILSGVIYSDLQDHIDDSKALTCPATFSDLQSAESPSPTCDATCPAVNYHHLLPERHFYK